MQFKNILFYDHVIVHYLEVSFKDVFMNNNFMNDFKRIIEFV